MCVLPIFLVSLKMTGTGFRFYPSTGWLHTIIAHHFKSESHFSSYFSRFSRISQLLDYAHLPSYACPHNPPNTFRIWNFNVIDSLQYQIMSPCTPVIILVGKMAARRIKALCKRNIIYIRQIQLKYLESTLGCMEK